MSNSQKIQLVLRMVVKHEGKTNSKTITDNSLDKHILLNNALPNPLIHSIQANMGHQMKQLIYLSTIRLSRRFCAVW